MKRTVIALLLLTIVFTVAACKGKDDSTGASSSVDTLSQISSVEITEGDFFTQNGTESEFEITKSEVEELFKNQESRDKKEETEESKTSSSDATSSKDESSKDTDSTDNPTSETVSKSETSSESKPTESVSDSSKSETTESKTNSTASSKPESTTKFDADGDGWTDGWN